VRVLVISDIHANLEALEACLATAPKYDLLANLGDIVGYGASPNEVIARSRELSRVVVRGNHDRACTTLEGIDQFNPVAALAAMWTNKSLTPENLQWLRELPAGPEALPGDGLTYEVLFVHGSPMDEDEYLVSLHDGLDVLMRSNVRLTFFGHTHLQGGFALGSSMGATVIKPQYPTKGEAEQFLIELESQTRYLINPGSVGQPRDGDWRAGMALFDSEENTITFFRVPYDVHAAQERIRAANLPARLASRLQDGR
jgi:diadenosine tetraphosphatase ApaH/serine/threonine PP2A family protein phosphatase